jgi:type II secretory pathway component PulM
VLRIEQNSSKFLRLRGKASAVNTMSATEVVVERVGGTHTPSPALLDQVLLPVEAAERLG